MSWNNLGEEAAREFWIVAGTIFALGMLAGATLVWWLK